jgi:threonine aldolase
MAGQSTNVRYDFVSDNVAGMAPEALEALIAANAGFAPAYGADAVTARAADLIRDMLDADAEVRFIHSGTAANGLALTLVAQPFEAVLAHEHAHIRTDEVGAPGFFGHGTAVDGLPGPSGKIDEAALTARIAEPYNGRRQSPGALSLTNATEYGAVYTAGEIACLAARARAAGLGVHLDGARLANAAAAGFDLKAIASSGVDVLVLGAAKAGASSTEALVVFDRKRARGLDARLKQAGQVASKGRMLAAPVLGLLESGAWLSHAVHANRMAARLGAALAARGRFALSHPVATNSVFLAMDPAAQAAVLDRGFASGRFHDGSVRFVCSWATTEAAVDELAQAIGAV